MTKIENVFKNKKAFIPFITAGDPSLSTTAECIKEMASNGADLIEIGIPFSDPTAEGVIIENASLRALEAGTTTDKVFDMVKTLRNEGVNIPLAFMTYANVIFGYGMDKFLTKCNECEICCAIVPDIPFEEKEEFQPFFTKYGVKLISLIAPTSHDRIQMIAKEAEGFIYCVSSLGVTGMRSEINTNVGEMVELVKKTKNIPCAIGFGISTPEQAAKMSQYADGVIVGSAVVKIVADKGVEAPKYVGEYVRSIKKAISSEMA